MEVSQTTRWKQKPLRYKGYMMCLMSAVKIVNKIFEDMCEGKMMDALLKYTPIPKIF